MEDRYVKEQDDIRLAQSLVRLYLDAMGNGLYWQGGQNAYAKIAISDFNRWVKNELLGSSDNPVHLTSVHRYKGAEADYIYLLRSLTMDEEPRNIFLLDHMMRKSPQTAQEEMCILYVAATRARIQNIIVEAIE